jgi:hypothetical protein
MGEINMCFSAQASFAAAGVLSILSLLSVKQAHTKKIMPLALTPLFFGIQQACEGFVWVTLHNGDSSSLLHLMSMYGFLFFAGMFWPSWIPFAAYYAEKSHKRKDLLFKTMWCGIIVSILFLWAWISKTTGAVIINHHIDYPVAHYPFGIINQFYGKIATHCLSILYGMATIVPFFISSIPYMKILGIMVALGALIAYIFYLVAFPSVWCFFAAACSIFAYFLVYNYEKDY